MNIVEYQPLKGSSYIELPIELRNSMKGLINIKNNDNECFRWCHIRFLNPQDSHSELIKRSDKHYLEKLDYSGIEFPIKINQYNKIEKQMRLTLMYLDMKTNNHIPFMCQKKNIKIIWNYY